LGATKLGIAAALIAAPLPALAQAWPAGAATTTGPAYAQPHAAIGAALEAPVWNAPAAATPAWSAPAPATPILKPPPPAPVQALPNVKIPAKAEWSDDQGLRLHYAEVVYKQRF
jgi:hypothetical protein